MRWQGLQVHPQLPLLLEALLQPRNNQLAALTRKCFSELHKRMQKAVVVGMVAKEETPMRRDGLTTTHPPLVWPLLVHKY